LVQYISIVRGEEFPLGDVPQGDMAAQEAPLLEVVRGEAGVRGGARVGQLAALIKQRRPAGAKHSIS
jgi:hypothetical protein